MVLYSRRNRLCNITWFNPPFSKNVATNIGRRFRSLVNKHFLRGSSLYKIFNPNTLKISYSCMPNMAAIIQQHNTIIVRKGQPATKDNTVSRKTCNCHGKDHCPLDSACLTRSIVYKATVQTDNNQREYIGLTVMTFKQRFNAHQHQCATRNTSTAQPSRSTSGR